MTTQIKTSNVSDLFAGVSLVTGIYTSTTVKGNNTGSTSSAVAEGTVRVRVLLDPPSAGCQDNCTSPDHRTLPDLGQGVVFDQRIQSLTANLGFIFTGQCAASPTTCTLTPEEITLVLDTTSAHSFNFLLPNVGVGTHNLVVQAPGAGMLRKFVSDRGKIRARRVSGNCAQHQRDVAIAVKNAREMALLPYTAR